MSAGDAALSVRDLQVHRGEAHVLEGVSFEVRPRRVTALLGRNGAGKTTTLMTILGLLEGSGSIRLYGEEILGVPTTTWSAEVSDTCPRTARYSAR